MDGLPTVLLLENVVVDEDDTMSDLLVGIDDSLCVFLMFLVSLVFLPLLLVVSLLPVLLLLVVVLPLLAVMGDLDLTYRLTMGSLLNISLVKFLQIAF